MQGSRRSAVLRLLEAAATPMEREPLERELLRLDGLQLTRDDPALGLRRAALLHALGMMGRDAAGVRKARAAYVDLLADGGLPEHVEPLVRELVHECDAYDPDDPGDPSGKEEKDPQAPPTRENR